jgi:hypothetical protein
MKKTTWAIIGLSFCVVALSIALVIVITQKKTEPTFSAELYDFSHMKIVPKPWLERSFSISPINAKMTGYYNEVFYRTPGLDEKVDFLAEREISVPYKVYMLKRSLQKRWYATKEEKK